MFFTPPPPPARAITVAIQRVAGREGYPSTRSFCHGWPGHPSRFWCSVYLSHPNGWGIRCFRSLFWIGADGRLRMNPRDVAVIPCLDQSPAPPGA